MPNPVPHHLERRRYYRIEDEVSLKYRVLSETEFAAMGTAIFQNGDLPLVSLASTLATTNTQLRYGLEKLKENFPEVALTLASLNDKLDLLIRLLLASENDLPSQPTHRVSLSASGLSFQTATEIPKDSKVEIKLLVFPSHLFILALGSVAYCRLEPARDSSPTYRIGMDFSHIRESDRDLLIRHVLQRQSSQLRELRKARTER